MIAFLVAMAVAAACTPSVVRLARRWRLIDVPNHRSSHASPVPRGGGIAIVAGSLAGVLVAAEVNRPAVALLMCSSVLALVGLLDDRRGLPPILRLVAQVLTPAIGAVLLDLRDGAAAILVVGAAVVGVAGYVNAFNFMDGINGISGSQAAVTGGSLAIVADHLGDRPMQLAALAVCGAAIGFLPFNAVRAKIFLGDVGSYFLGCWLAAVALLLVEGGAPAPVVLGPFLLYLLDTGTVLVRRAVRGAPLMQAHREHTYQRLVQLGYSHPAIAGVCVIVTAVCSATMLVLIDRSRSTQWIGLACCVGVVGVYLAMPSALQRRALARSEAIS